MAFESKVSERPSMTASLGCLSEIDGKYGVDITSVTFNSSKVLMGDFACNDEQMAELTF